VLVTSCLPIRELFRTICLVPLDATLNQCSTFSIFSYLFGAGQVLPTDRGRGVYQPSIDRSIELLERGQWVHIFPEGYVNMSRRAHMRRFKWGIGRMLMEAGLQSTKRPLVIPMWISGESSIEFDAHHSL
jgi:1-acyl-sn-glycerol-3-phosphate acyltransferase